MTARATVPTPRMEFAGAAADALPPVIRALLDPKIYPHPVEQVDLVQTHISFVLLAGDFVYKIKKPVDLGFLNFTTLPRRQYYCRQEVILNSRLCTGVYLDVLPVTTDGTNYRLGLHNRYRRVVEYAVRMRRLPSDRMMDHLLEANAVTPAMVETLADRMAAFHDRSARGSSIDHFGSPRTIARNWRENFDQAKAFAGTTFTRWQDMLLRDYVPAFIARNKRLFRKRVRDGRVRDCHGDLRASAVCFTDDICVYDCIEFNHRFRYSDVATEIAFLVMDLDRRGHHELSETFVQRYAAVADDPDLMSLIDFYACYRAYVRGKVASFRLNQPETSVQEKKASAVIARQAFALACTYATRNRPLLLITCGFSGSGKSALAAGMARQTDLDVIASDRVRKELAGIDPHERQQGGFNTGIYAPHFSARTYAEMLERARARLAEGRSVLLDATFARRKDRDQARQLAINSGALFFCLECTASDATITARLVARDRDDAVVSDARVSTYRSQQRSFEPVRELTDWQHIVVNLDQPLDEAVAQTFDALRARVNPTWEPAQRYSLSSLGQISGGS